MQYVLCERKIYAFYIDHALSNDLTLIGIMNYNLMFSYDRCLLIRKKLVADNLYIVGDWVGKEGWLSNASVASANHAAQLILNE